MFTFLDLLRWKYDSNLTLNVLLRILRELSKVKVTYMKQSGERGLVNQDLTYNEMATPLIYFQDRRDSQ